MRVDNFYAIGRYLEVMLRFTRGRVENPELASGLSLQSFVRSSQKYFRFIPNAG